MNHSVITRIQRLADELIGIADHAAIESTSSDEPATRCRRLVEQFVAAIDDGDLDAAAALLHHDIVHVVSGRSRVAGVYEGVDAVVQAFGVAPREGARDLRSKMVRLFADVGEVVTFHEVSGVLDRQPFAFEVALRFTIRQERICEINEYSADQHRSDDLFR